MSTQPGHYSVGGCNEYQWRLWVHRHTARCTWCLLLLHSTSHFALFTTTISNNRKLSHWSSETHSSEMMRDRPAPDRRRLQSTFSTEKHFQAALQMPWNHSRLWWLLTDHDSDMLDPTTIHTCASCTVYLPESFHTLCQQQLCLVMTAN